MRHIPGPLELQVFKKQRNRGATAQVEDGGQNDERLVLA